jgi:hypothetical protein
LSKIGKIPRNFVLLANRRVSPGTATHNRPMALHQSTQNGVDISLDVFRKKSNSTVFFLDERQANSR